MEGDVCREHDNLIRDQKEPFQTGCLETGGRARFADRPVTPKLCEGGSPESPIRIKSQVLKKSKIFVF